MRKIGDWIFETKWGQFIFVFSFSVIFNIGLIRKFDTPELFWLFICLGLIVSFALALFGRNKKWY